MAARRSAARARGVGVLAASPPQWSAAALAPRCLLLLLLLLTPLAARAQLSKPVAHASHVLSGANLSSLKFLSRPTPPPDHHSPPRRSYDDVAREAAACGQPLDVDVAWMATVGSSVHATPLITDLHSDARKEVIVPAFVHELEALEAPNGAKGASGAAWPAFHASTLHASPFLVDADGDGTREVAAATYDGEVLYFRESGERLPGYVSTVPRLRVRREWFVGLAEDPVDHLHPDVKGAVAAAQAEVDRRAKLGPFFGGGSAERLRHVEEMAALAGKTPAVVEAGGQGGGGGAVAAGGAAAAGHGRRRLMQVAEEAQGQQQQPAQEQAQQQQQQQPKPEQKQQVGGSNNDGKAAAAATEKAETAGAAKGKGAAPPLSDEAAASYDALFADYGAGGGGAGAHAQGKDEGKKPREQQQGQDPQLQPAAADPDRHDAPQVDAFGDPLPAAFAAADEGGAGAGAGAGGDGAPFQDGPRGRAPPHHDPSLSEQWGDEQGFWRAGQHAILDEGEGHGGDRPSRADEHVWLDAHVLATPAVGDVDGDGHPEVVVPVSYFFDRAQYEGRRSREVNGLDLSKYVAGGVVAFSLYGRHQSSPLWSAHLDLTTDTTPFRAYVYSPPTLVDADGDGTLDVVVGTSVGFLYVLDGRTGAAKRGWPRQMGPVEAQALAADVNGDGKLELVAADTLGNVACFDAATGEEVWERYLGPGAGAGAGAGVGGGGGASSAPVAGDVDGDGELEVVVAAADGRVFVLKGSDGKDKPGWPYRAGGGIAAQPTIVALEPEDYGGDELPGGGAAAGAAHARAAAAGGGGTRAGARPPGGLLGALLAGLRRHPPAPPPAAQAPNSNNNSPTTYKRPQQHVAVAAMDGLLYLIGGRSACAHVVDLGEPSSSSVLADDLFGDGTLGLVAATLGGTVFGLATRSPYHPLKTWPAQAQGPHGAGLVARWGWLGVSASPQCRAPRDVAGRDMVLELDLVDGRPVASRPKVQAYNVTALYKGVGVREMNNGDTPVIGVADALPFPGRHAVRMPTPRSRATAVLSVELTDQHGLRYADEFALSFHVHFHRLLKWLVALPLLGMALALLLLTGGMGGGDDALLAARPEQRDVARHLLSGGGGGGGVGGGRFHLG